MPPKRIVLGVTGASGIIYAIRILETLSEMDDVETHLILSDAALQTLGYETEYSSEYLNNLADVVYEHDDVAAPISSGSFPTSGMIIAPCSVNTLASVAHSITGNLITRAADVSLKERRRLVVLFRETPLHSGHLENMLRLDRIGGILMPPVPAFYQNPKTIDELVNHTVGRVLDLMGIEQKLSTPWESPT